MLSPFFPHGLSLHRREQAPHKMACWEDLRQLANLQASVNHRRMCLDMGKHYSVTNEVCFY